MEPLWSPVVATGGNPWQMRGAEIGSNKRTSFAVSCDQLPESFHGKTPGEPTATCRRWVAYAVAPRVVRESAAETGGPPPETGTWRLNLTVATAVTRSLG